MAKTIGLVQGHYECRSLDETLPIFTDLLALEVVERYDGQAIVKHPNTEWRLVIHEGGSDAVSGQGIGSPGDDPRDPPV